MLTIEDLKQQGLIVLECLSGSRAYGLDTPQSDTDLRGVFILPQDLFYGFGAIDQVSSERNDIVYYELNKYLALLSRNNPSAMELLFTPPESTYVRHPLMDLVDPAKVVSKLCRDSFAGYAMSQVKRAKGLNKKMFNPKTGELPVAIDFCWVLDGERTLPVKAWLDREGLDVAGCGLSALPHIRDGYALFHIADASAGIEFGGLFRSDRRSVEAPVSQDVCLSSIPMGMKPRTWLFFNKDDFSRQHKEFQEYKTWEASRNNERYQSNLEHGGGYDAKNMMHTFRLLRMAREIAESGRPLLRRPDREELLSIKRGMFGYQDLLDRAVAEIAAIDQAFAHSALPEEPDASLFESWAVAIRKGWYAVRTD